MYSVQKRLKIFHTFLAKTDISDCLILRQNLLKCLFHSVHQGHDGGPGPKGQKGYSGKSGHDVMLFLYCSTFDIYMMYHFTYLYDIVLYTYA